MESVPVTDSTSVKFAKIKVHNIIAPRYTVVPA